MKIVFIIVVIENSSSSRSIDCQSYIDICDSIVDKSNHGLNSNGIWSYICSCFSLSYEVVNLIIAVEYYHYWYQL